MSGERRVHRKGPLLPSIYPQMCHLKIDLPFYNNEKELHREEKYFTKFLRW